MNPDEPTSVRSCRVSAEIRWFWWGVAWGMTAVLSGSGFFLLHRKAETVIRSGLGGRSSGELGDAFADSLTASVLGLTLTAVCWLAFLVCWGRWLAEIRERR